MKQLILNLQADTEPTGEMSQSSSPVGFRKGGENHANHSALQESNLERKMTDTSGRRCVELFEKLSQIGAFSKTFAALLIGQGDWSSSRCRLTWKLKGTKSSRLYFQLVPSTLPTDGIEFGLLPTPKALMPLESEDSIIENGRVIRKSGEDYGVNLAVMAQKGMLLPTPRTADVEGGTVKNVQEKDGYFFRENSKGVRWGVKLRDVIENGLLPTPKTQDCRHAMNDRGKSNLGEEIAQWAKEDGQTSQYLSPLFTAEMMGFKTDWTVLPFLSGEPNPSKHTGMP